MDAPKISIVLPTLKPDYSTEKLAPMLVSRRVLEVIIVSQHPNAEQELAEDRQAGARIIRLRLDRCGTSLARNAGVAAAAGDVVVFMDDDVTPHPDYPDVIESAFADPEAALLITSVHYGNGWPNVADRSWRTVRKFRDALGSGSVISVRRQTLIKQGISFHDELGGGRSIVCGEDSVFTLEIWRCGLKVLRSDFKSVLHPSHGSTGWRTDDVYLVSLAYVLRKHYGLSGWHVLLRTALRLLLKNLRPGAAIKLPYYFLTGRSPATMTELRDTAGPNLRV